MVCWRKWAIVIQHAWCQPQEPVGAQPNIVTISSTGDEIIIDAVFIAGGFQAETTGSQTSARSYCRILYDLNLDPGYRVEGAKFIADGQYELSENGTASIKIRYSTMGSLNPQFEYRSYSARRNDPSDGNYDITGSIEGLDDYLTTCGAKIPFDLQVTATARRGRSDSLDTFVTVDQGSGRSNPSRITGRIRLKKCST